MEDKIDKINKMLECLDDQKCKLEDKVQKILKEIACTAKKIDKAECEVEQALHEKLAKECQERMRCEIARLKQEQKRAERILCRYDEQLKQKMKQLKNCQAGTACDE